MRSGSPEKSTLSNRTRRVVEYTDNFGNLCQRVLIPARMVVGYLYDAFPAAHGSKGYPIRIPRTIFGNGIGGC
jgi:hypothetical protein